MPRLNKGGQRPFDGDLSHVPTNLKTRFSGHWVNRILSKIDFSGDCWLWTGSTNTSGYGSVSSKHGYCYAATGECFSNRIAYVLFVKPIPAGKHVLHHCDVRACMNPEHLYTGTNDDNVQDRNRRNRTAHNTGEKHGRAVLTWEQVRAIRSDWASNQGTQAVLAKKYRMSRSQIQYIIYNKGWKES